MFCTRKVNDDYTWVGADGRRLAMFEGVYDVPRGVSFNSYLLRRARRYFLDVADCLYRWSDRLYRIYAGADL